MKECAILGIKQIVTSFNNPNGHADSERMMRTLKEELMGSNEFDDFEKLRVALNAWVDDYNTNSLHSTLGCVSPNVFKNQCLDQNSNPPLMAA